MTSSSANQPGAQEGITHLVSLSEFVHEDAGSAGRNHAELARWCCEQLERGNILFFPFIPFQFPQEDRASLLGQRQSDARYHKNIAYRPSQDRLTGFAKGRLEEEAKLRAILRAYSDRVARFLDELLPPYVGRCRRDFASFRPVEEQNRQLRLRARNDLLHTDAFPTRPTNGDRILRVFTNINPSEPRVWVTSETFEALAQRLARHAGLDRIALGAWSGWRRTLRQLGRTLGFPGADRPPYDAFMLCFHNYLKENQGFQLTCPKNRWEFPPCSTWIVFTDMVSHAVLTGQFALEQTFIVSRKALVLPEKAPARILEKLCGRSLTET